MTELFLDVSFRKVVEGVKDESYLTHEGIMRMGCIERIVRWLLSWTTLVDTIIVACAKRSLEFIKSTFEEEFEASKTKAPLFDRCQLLRDLYGEDLRAEFVELYDLSKEVHDLYFSFLTLDLFFSGYEASNLKAPWDHQCTLANVLLKGGEHTTKNPLKARSLLEPLASKNVPRACFMLAELHYQGADRIPRNHRVALEYLRKAVDLRYPAAQYQLGVFQRDGLGVEKDLDEARRLFGLAAGQGLAQASQALEELQPSGWEKARSYLGRVFGGAGSGGDPALNAERRRALEQGETASLMRLATRYIEGNGVEIDVERARHLLANAAVESDEAIDALIRTTEQEGAAAIVNPTPLVPFEYLGAEITEERRSQCLLAVGEYFLEMTHYDPERALACFQRAKEKGNLDARLALARCYERGEGVPRKDPKLARRYVKEAVDRRHLPALCVYARYLFVGFGGKRDPQEAVQHLRIASDLGNPQAKVMLAECALEGKGMMRDIRRGQRLLQEVVDELGERAPINALVLRAEQLERGGPGQERDVQGARRLYEMAADKPDVMALLHLGDMVERQLIEGTPEEGFAYYERAYQEERRTASFGGAFEEAKPATFQFARLFESGIGCSRNPIRALSLYCEAARGGSVRAAEELLAIFQDGNRLAVSRLLPDWKQRAGKIEKLLRLSPTGRRYQRGAQEVFREPFQRGL